MDKKLEVYNAFVSVEDILCAFTEAPSSYATGMIVELIVGNYLSTKDLKKIIKVANETYNEDTLYKEIDKTMAKKKPSKGKPKPC